MTTLYRKWRPQTFAEVFGQERVVRTLQNALSAGRIGHAYLFCGPRGCGKTTTARLLAKAVNCLHDDGASAPGGGIPVEPDNTCSMCRQIADGRSLDVIEIDAASNGRVDDARDLRDQINFAPNEARYKVYIIDEAHQITKDAFDALLKTFEEPPAHVIFVLATTDPNKVPVTILSRCQRLDFRRHSVLDLRADLARICGLEGIEADPAALEVIARAADGSSRDSLSLLDQAIAFSGTQISLEAVRGMLGLASAETIESLAAALLEGDAGTGLELINQAADAGVDARSLNRELVEHLRTLLLLKVSSENAASLDVAAERLPALREQAASLSGPVLVRQIKILSEADFGFRSAVQAQLPLELAFLQAIETARAAEAVPAAEPATQARAAAPNPFAFGTGAGPTRRPTRAPTPEPGRSQTAPAEQANASAETPARPASPPAAAGASTTPRESAASMPAPQPSPAESAAREPAASPQAPQPPPAATATREPAASTQAPQPAAAAVPAGEPATQAYEPPKAPEPAELALKDGATAEYAPAAGDITVATFVERWQQVRQAVRSRGAKNLEALLISCTPVEFDGQTLTLEGPEFHTREIQSKPDNKHLTEEALSLVAGRPCYVKCVVRPNQKKTDGPAAGGASLTAGQADTARPDDDDPLVRAALRMLNAGRVLENS
jgi:DNA polymerase-3 subunit gamma/tau